MSCLGKNLCHDFVITLLNLCCKFVVTLLQICWNFVITFSKSYIKGKTMTLFVVNAYSANNSMFIFLKLFHIYIKFEDKLSIVVTL